MSVQSFCYQVKSHIDGGARPVRPQRDAGDGIVSTTTGPSNSSRGPQACIKKSIDKHQVLIRRVNGGGGPKTKGNLDRDFDKREDEPEPILADEAAAPPQTAASSAEGAPSEARSVDFWEKMDLMMCRKIGMLSTEVSIARNGLECKLATRIQEEVECRQSEARAANEQLEMADKGEEEDGESVKETAAVGRSGQRGSSSSAGHEVVGEARLRRESLVAIRSEKHHSRHPLTPT